VAEPTGTSYQTIVHRQETPVLKHAPECHRTRLTPAVGWSRANSNRYILNRPAVFFEKNGYLLSDFAPVCPVPLGTSNCSAALIDSYFACMPTFPQTMMQPSDLEPEIRTVYTKTSSHQSAAAGQVPHPQPDSKSTPSQMFTKEHSLSEQ